VEVAQQEVSPWLQDEDSPPQQVPKSQTASSLLATGLDFTEKIAAARSVPLKDRAEPEDAAVG
jgi:hypothetical protein